MVTPNGSLPHADPRTSHGDHAPTLIADGGLVTPVGPTSSTKPAFGARGRWLEATALHDPGGRLVTLCEREGLGLTGSHPTEEASEMLYPPDVGHQRDPLEGSNVLDAKFEILPEARLTFRRSRESR